MGKHAKASASRSVRPMAAKIILWTLLLAVVGSIAYIGFFQPPPPVKTVKVKIKPGLNTAQIADLLVAKGVISNAYTFRAYASLTQTELSLQPGNYELKSSMTYYDILKKLTAAPKKRYVTVVVPEGFTVKQIIDRLAAETGRPEVDFSEYARGQGLVDIKPSDLPDDVKTVEGYLFPKTYTLEKVEHPKGLIKRMVKQWQLETAEIDWSFAKEKNLSIHQIMTIASLIETEAKVPEERPLVSAVIYNRLSKSMPLQIDATVQYALPKRKDALTNDDLKIASPYNTYQHIGLPPGPIANPGIDSIKAALAPAPVDYIYYVLTSPDGRHTFTNNYNDFLAAKRQMSQ